MCVRIMTQRTHSHARIGTRDRNTMNSNFEAEKKSKQTNRRSFKLNTKWFSMLMLRLWGYGCNLLGAFVDCAFCDKIQTREKKNRMKCAKISVFCGGADKKNCRKKIKRNYHHKIFTHISTTTSQFELKPMARWANRQSPTREGRKHTHNRCCCCCCCC